MLLNDSGPAERNDSTEQDAEEPQKLDSRAYKCLLGGFLLHFVLGNLYLWGNISTYVISYFHYQGDLDANSKRTVQVIPISMLFLHLGSPFGPYLAKRYDVKIILSLCSTVCCLSIYAASLSTNWKNFFLFYAMIFPFSIGIIFWIPIICSWEWI